MAAGTVHASVYERAAHTAAKTVVVPEGVRAWHVHIEPMTTQGDQIESVQGANPGELIRKSLNPRSYHAKKHGSNRSEQHSEGNLEMYLTHAAAGFQCTASLVS